MLLFKKLFPLFFLSSTLIFSQNFKNIDVANGLPSTIVYDITQDKLNTLWIATFGGGICKYDGKNYTYINTSHGLNSDLVRCIYIEEDSNRVWVGSSIGLNIITKDSIYDVSKDYFGSAIEVIDITKDKNGVLWFATTKGIYKRTKNKTFHFTERTNRKGLFEPTIFTQLINPDGECFFGLREGLIILKNNKLTTYNEKDGLPSKTVTSLTKDKSGKIIIGTPKGLCYYENGKFTIPKFENPKLNNLYIRNILFDDKENLWIATRHGLVYLDMKTEEARFFAAMEGLTYPEVRCVFIDSEKNVWLGTMEGGLYKFLDNNIKRVSESNGLPTNHVIDITKDKDNRLWLLTKKGYGYINDKDSFEIKNSLKEYKDIDFIKLCVDKEQNVWLASNKGAYSFSPTNKMSFYTISTNSSINSVNTVF
jgi:ligand-binding sensor domain-containing protein